MCKRVSPHVFIFSRTTTNPGAMCISQKEEKRNGTSENDFTDGTDTNGAKPLLMKCDLGPLSCPGGFRVVPFVESISAPLSGSVFFNMTSAARALQLAADRERQCGEGYTGMACRACTEHYILASTDEGEKREKR